MQAFDFDNFAWIVAAEWVVGDDRKHLKVGQRWAISVRPFDEEDESHLPTTVETLVAGKSAAPIYVWHADDPDPPLRLDCLISRIGLCAIATSLSSLLE